MAMDATEYDLEMNTSSNPEANNGAENSPSDEEILLEPSEEEVKREQLKERMRELQVEIAELSDQLQRKYDELGSVKKELGITPFTEFKDSVATGVKVIGNKLKEIQESEPYRKTNEKLTSWKDKLESSERYQKTKDTLNAAGNKTSAMLSKAGTSISTTTSSAYHKVKENERIQSMGSTIRSTSIKLKDRVLGTSMDKGDELSGEEVMATDEPPKQDI